MSIKRMQLTTLVFRGRSLSCEPGKFCHKKRTRSWRVVASQLMRRAVRLHEDVVAYLRASNP